MEKILNRACVVGIVVAIAYMTVMAARFFNNLYSLTF